MHVKYIREYDNDDRIKMKTMMFDDDDDDHAYIIILFSIPIGYVPTIVTLIT